MDHEKHTWLRTEIAEGFQLLVTLSLEGQPARDVMEYTLRTWASAIASDLGNPVEGIDAPRIRHAFALLCRRGRRWPVPQDFFDVLPPRPPRRRIDTLIPDPTPEEKQAVECLINKLLEKLDGKKTHSTTGGS